MNKQFTVALVTAVLGTQATAQAIDPSQFPLEQGVYSMAPGRCGSPNDDGRVRFQGVNLEFHESACTITGIRSANFGAFGEYTLVSSCEGEGEVWEDVLVYDVTSPTSFTIVTEWGNQDFVYCGR